MKNNKQRTFDEWWNDQTEIMFKPDINKENYRLL